jgi:hypothetical protein
MDRHLRTLERAAARGDPGARGRLALARFRLGSLRSGARSLGEYLQALEWALGLPGFRFQGTDRFRYDSGLLTSLQEIGRVRAAALLERFGDLSCVAAAEPEELEEVLPRRVARYVHWATRGFQPNDVARFRHEDTGLVFCLIPGGPTTFRRGGVPCATGVGSFLLCETPCTQAAYGHVLGRHHQRMADDLPAGNVTWAGAEAFGERSALRLPSSTEWEYACRAGTRTNYFCGARSRLLDYAHRGLMSQDPVRLKTKLANPFGLFDVYGNVWEWCQDTTSWGGSWDHERIADSSTSRRYNLSTRRRRQGFRPALSPPGANTKVYEPEQAYSPPPPRRRARPWRPLPRPRPVSRVAPVAPVARAPELPLSPEAKRERFLAGLRAGDSVYVAALGATGRVLEVKRKKGTARVLCGSFHVETALQGLLPRA